MGATLLSYQIKAQIGGKLAQFGQRHGQKNWPTKLNRAFNARSDVAGLWGYRSRDRRGRRRSTAGANQKPTAMLPAHPIGNAKVDDSRIDYSSTTILLKRRLPLLKRISL
jgi:hypothetical protein